MYRIDPTGNSDETIHNLVLADGVQAKRPIDAQLEFTE